MNGSFSEQPTPAERRLLKHFAAFAHHLRQAAAARPSGDARVELLSDTCVLLHKGGADPRALLVEPQTRNGPRGRELFIHCREAREGIAPGHDPLPLVAAWRCDGRGVVTRHPEPSDAPLGYLCDSVVAMHVLSALASESSYPRPEPRIPPAVRFEGALRALAAWRS